MSTAKNNFYKDQIENSKDNPKKLWQNINNILHRTPVAILPDHDSEIELALRATFPARPLAHLLGKRMPGYFNYTHHKTYESVSV